ncbi:C25 family cysteine peptidase [Bacteroidota bacterium]
MKRFCYISFILLFFFTNNLVSLEDLKSTDNQADYLCVYHPEFKESIQKFIEWRRLKGVNIVPIDVNEIYKEFGDSVSNVDAIRDFVSYALEYWKEPEPGYLLLVGGINHIPAYKQRPWWWADEKDSVTIDDYYAINKYYVNENPHLPAIAIGRFPARNPKDLHIMIDKTIMFEDESEEIDYKYDALVSADREDYKLFEKYSNEIVELTLPRYLSIKRFDYREDSKYFGDKEDFINNINDGSVFLVNFFHGGEDVWMYNALLTSNDVDILKFSSKPFLIASMSCHQRWDDSLQKGIIEIFLCKNRSGAVATIAPNGLNYASMGFEFIRKIMREIFLSGVKEYGYAVLKAKQYYKSELVARHTYLGDPMLRLPDRLFEPNAITEYFKSMSFSNYPNPCDEYTNIVFTIPDNSYVELEVFDILGNKIDILFSDYSYQGIQNIHWITSSLPSGIYICILKYGQNVLSKTIIVN